MIPAQTDIRNWTIYKITSPSNRVYIGLTQDIIARKKDYERGDCYNQTAIYRSLKKYSFSSHTFSIVDAFSSDQYYALGKEMFWIRGYMSNSGKFPKQRGLNMTDGGRGSLGKKMSESTKEKLRQANLGKKYSEETKKRLSEMRMGKKNTVCWTEEKRQKMRDTKLANPHKHTDEAKRKISEASKGNKHNLGRKSSPETIEKLRRYLIGNKINLGRRASENQKSTMIKLLSKPILQYSLCGEFIKEYPSLKIASKEIKISIWSIWKSAKGGTKKPKRFIFKYK